MKALTILLIPALALVPSDVDERKAVERAVLDYVEGLYEAKPELIARSVHPELAKIGYSKPQGKAGAPYQPGKMTYKVLHGLAGTWNKAGDKIDANTPKKVEVLDMLDQIAVVKLTAKWGIDYMNLAKYEGRWKIVQVMWQTHPAK